MSYVLLVNKDLDLVYMELLLGLALKKTYTLCSAEHQGFGIALTAFSILILHSIFVLSDCLNPLLIVLDWQMVV